MLPWWATSQSRLLHMGGNGIGGEQAGNQRQKYCKCRGCGYKWNFTKNVTCFQCGRGIQPAKSTERQPEGVWSDSSARRRSRPRQGQGGGTAAASPQLALLQQLRETLPATAGADTVAHVEHLERALAPPPPEHPDVALNQARARVRRAEATLRRAIQSVSEAKDWLTVKEKEHEDAILEVALAEQASEAAYAQAAPAGQAAAAAGTAVAAGAEAAGPKEAALDLSKLLVEDAAVLEVRPGALFDLDGLDVSAEEKEQFQQQVSTFVAQLQGEVQKHFGPAAEALRGMRAELKTTHDRLKAKRPRSSPPDHATEQGPNDAPGGGAAKAPTQVGGGGSQGSQGVQAPGAPSGPLGPGAGGPAVGPSAGSPPGPTLDAATRARILQRVAGSPGGPPDMA